MMEILSIMMDVQRSVKRSQYVVIILSKWENNAMMVMQGGEMVVLVPVSLKTHGNVWVNPQFVRRCVVMES